jgi:hypothetical protein
LQEAFTGSARPGIPRLVVDVADLSGETAGGMQAAVNSFAVGCYQGIRNPAAHEDEAGWDEQLALEYLASWPGGRNRWPRPTPAAPTIRFPGDRPRALRATGGAG